MLLYNSVMYVTLFIYLNSDFNLKTVTILIQLNAYVMSYMFNYKW